MSYTSLLEVQGTIMLLVSSFLFYLSLGYLVLICTCRNPLYYLFTPDKYCGNLFNVNKFNVINVNVFNVNNVKINKTSFSWIPSKCPQKKNNSLPSYNIPALGSQSHKSHVKHALFLVMASWICKLVHIRKHHCTITYISDHVPPSYWPVVLKVHQQLHWRVLLDKSLLYFEFPEKIVNKLFPL